MFDALTPYLLYIKLFLLAALLGATAYGGYMLGVDHTTTKWDADKVVFAQKETDWATEKAALNAAQAIKLAEVTAKAQADQLAMAKKADEAASKYASDIARLKVAQEAAHKVAEGTTPTDGLWVNTVSCVKAPDGAMRCRIANDDADLLVSLVSLADDRTVLLNQCIARVNIVPPPTVATTTTTTK